jgi:hypothetical protein
VDRTVAAVTTGREGGDRPASGRIGAAPGWTWPRATRLERFFQIALAALLGGAVALGLYLTPSATGTGTHTLLGIPPCGMLIATGKPCPTCGVTTSFALAAHGRFGESLVNQPFGLALFILAVTGLLLTVTTAAAGRSWYPLVTRWSVPSFIMALIILGLLSWMYKWSTM